MKKVRVKFDKINTTLNVTVWKQIGLSKMKYYHVHHKEYPAFWCNSNKEIIDKPIYDSHGNKLEIKSIREIALEQISIPNTVRVEEERFKKLMLMFKNKSIYSNANISTTEWLFYRSRIYKSETRVIDYYGSTLIIEISTARHTECGIEFYIISYRAQTITTLFDKSLIQELNFESD